MIDIEQDIFDLCCRAILADYPDTFVTSRYVSSPASFPAASVMETNNATDEGRIDSSLTERGASVAYEVRAYSNKKTGARQEVRGIINSVDAALTSLNFIRTAYRLEQSTEDTSIVQAACTYRAGVDENNKTYRR